jgi:hypothetical protein
MAAMGPQDRRLAAIGAAAATVLSETDYHRVRTQDVASRVKLDATGDGRSATGSRSSVWLYNEVRSRRVLVMLAARHVWEVHTAQTSEPLAPQGFAGAGKTAEPATVTGTVTEAYEAVTAALLDIVRFHRASSFLMTQVGLGLGDIATSEKRSGAEAQQPPTWPDSGWGRVAADGFAGRCGVFADFLAPVLLSASHRHRLGDCPIWYSAPCKVIRTARPIGSRAGWPHTGSSVTWSVSPAAGSGSCWPLSGGSRMTTAGRRTRVRTRSCAAP